MTWAEETPVQKPPMPGDRIRVTIEATVVQWAGETEGAGFDVAYIGANTACLELPRNEPGTDVRVEVLKRQEPPLRACRRCGCTNDRACPGGCSWVEADLCSECR